MLHCKLTLLFFVITEYLLEILRDYANVLFLLRVCLSYYLLADLACGIYYCGVQMVIFLFVSFLLYLIIGILLEGRTVDSGFIFLIISRYSG